MPRLPDDFDTIEPGSELDYTIGFDGNIPSGVTIDAASWSLAVRYVAPGYTLDPSPSDRLLGAPTIVDTLTIQRISNLYAGNTYLVTATATLSDGEVVILWCTLSCVEPV
jgi:hypothetical protein